MDFSDKKRKLLSLKELIMRMPSNSNKVNMIDGFAQLLGYYKEVCGLSNKEIKEFNIDDEFVDKYDKRITKATQNKINEITKLAPYLYKIYDWL